MKNALPATKCFKVLCVRAWVGLLFLGPLIFPNPASAQASSSASAPVTELEGSWVQGCQNRATHEEHFQGAKVSLFEVNYSDSDCHSPAIQIENAGTYTIDTDPVPSGQRSIDFTFEAVRITLFSQAYLDYYRSRSVCGISNWQIGKAEDVTGGVCELFGPGIETGIPGPGDKRYGIFKVEKGKLWFGQLTLKLNGLTPDKRPTQFESRPYIFNSTQPPAGG